MAARKAPKQHRLDLNEVTKRVPTARPRELDAALAVSNALAIARELMITHLEIDPAATKLELHLELELRLADFVLTEAQRPRPPKPSAEQLAARRDRRDQKRRAQLEKLLRRHRGNVSEVARVMEKGRNQIVRWIERYDLDPDRYRIG